MKLLVTGASGFVGRNLLLKAPADWRITALYNNDEGFSEFVGGLGAPNIVAVQCDLSSPDATIALSQQYGADWECCLYLAGRVDIPWSVREPRADLLTNTVSLLNLLENVHVNKFVYFSSGAVYEGSTGEVRPGTAVKPTLPYAISKLACEHYVECFHHRRKSLASYLIVRFFGAYGPYEAPHKIYTRLIRAFALDGHDRYTIYGDGGNLIDAMYIDDAVDAILRMLTGDHWNTIVNLAGGNPTRVDDLVRQVGKVLGLPSVIVDKQSIANERNEFWGSTVEMRDAFGFKPQIELNEGVRRFRDFLAG